MWQDDAGLNPLPRIVILPRRTSPGPYVVTLGRPFLRGAALFYFLGFVGWALPSGVFWAPNDVLIV